MAVERFFHLITLYKTIKLINTLSILSFYKNSITDNQSDKSEL